MNKLKTLFLAAGLTTVALTGCGKNSPIGPNDSVALDTEVGAVDTEKDDGPLQVGDLVQMALDGGLAIIKVLETGDTSSSTGSVVFEYERTM